MNVQTPLALQHTMLFFTKRIAIFSCTILFIMWSNHDAMAQEEHVTIQIEGPATITCSIERLVDPGSPDDPEPPTDVILGSVTLTWTVATENTDGSPLTNLRGHRIYYGTEPGDRSSMFSLRDTLSPYLVTDLPLGEYCFVMTTVNDEMVESVYSNEVCKTAVP